MGNFEEVERLQAGIREWLLRTARSGRHELHSIPAPAVLPLLCAAAFGPELADAADVASVVAVARTGVLSSVGASVLGDVLAAALDRARSAHPGRDLSRADLQREISRSLKEILTGPGERAEAVRSDIAMVLREIDAGGTVFLAAIEAGDEELQREVLTAVEAVSAEFGEMEFLLADLTRAAGEIQDSLADQGAELRVTSDRVGRQSADVRMIREELAVIEQRTRAWVPESADREQARPRWTGGCPYRGLLPYDQAHAAVFYGRDRLTAQLAGLLAHGGLVMVTGASGAGKTSLLQAGLVPALARGVQVPGSQSWPRITMTPASRPLTELAARLAQLSGGDPAVTRKSLAEAPGDAHLLVGDIVRAAAGGDIVRPAAGGDIVRAAAGGGRGRDGALAEVSRLVLIIDQFEQVFAAAGEEAEQERAAFIDAVCAAATRPAGPRNEPAALVVIAVRGDYWDRCASCPQLVPAMQRDQLVVGPMAEADLRRVITGPPEASGLRMEDGLADTILADLRSAREGGQSGPGTGTGVLPLLSAAMLVTWEHRQGDQLTKRGYEGTGERAGVARSVEVSAETAYQALTPDQQAVARDVLRRMTALGPDRRPARRAVTRADLHAGLPESQSPQVAAVLEAFARSRLLVLDADRAEIAHDVLLQAWPRLRGWLEEDQTSMILHGRLAEDTAQWQADGRSSAALYRDVQLAATRQAVRVWAADPGRYPPLTAGETEFLRSSGRAANRGRWRRRTLAGFLAVLVIAALAGAGIAVKRARANADQQRTADVGQSLAAQSAALDASDPVTASLLAGAAWRLSPTAQARYGLLESLAQPVRGVLAARSGVVTALAYSPGGTTLAAGYQDGTIRLWDIASHRVISATTWGGSAPVTLAFASGGKVLDVAGPGATGSWNLTSRARIGVRPLAGLTEGSAVAFSPDGKLVVTGGTDGNVRVWNTGTGQEIGTPMSSDDKPVDAVAFSPGGTLIAAASADGNVQLWDATSQQVAGSALVAAGPQVRALVFSPDGRLLATGAQDGTVRLWDTTTGDQAGATMATGDAVGALAFGNGGATLATTQSDGATELWQVSTQAQTGAALTTQGSPGVSALAFSPSTDALATGNGNGTIRLWNPAGFHQGPAPLAVGPAGSPAGAAHAPAALSADGTVVAVSDGHGTVRVWDVATGRRIGGPLPAYRDVTGLALSPDGRTLAIAGTGVRLFATATGQPIGTALPASGGSGSYGAVAFSPAGKTLATIGTDGTARLWNVTTRQEIGAPMTAGPPGASAGAVAFSPDGGTLATAAAGGQVRLWKVTTQRETGAPMAAGAGTAVLAFSPDGSMLATAGGSGTVRLWDAATQQEAGTPMTADAQPVYAAAFSPDGSMLATAGGDGTVRLWDAATQQEIGTPMTADAQPVYAAAFSPDGSTVTAAGGDGTVRAWNVAFPANLLRAACGIADVSLTRQQWADYAGTQPFRQVCPAG
jgi:WD40 repeat protein